MLRWLMKKMRRVNCCMIVVYWLVGVLLVYYLFQAEILLLKSSSLVENTDAIRNLHKNQENTNSIKDLHKKQEWKGDVYVEENLMSKKEKPSLKSDVDFYEENIMSKRRKVMHDACLQEGLDQAGHDSLHEVNPWEYFINKKHKLVWCNVFKSASTSWMYIFNVLAGYSPQYLEKTRAVPLQLARNKYPRPSVDELVSFINKKDVISFIIGRYKIFFPFDISAELF